MTSIKPDERIKKGSVVRMKSGGPEMTVQSIFEDSNGHTVARCAWFGKDNLVLTDKFVLESLAYLND